MKRNIILVVITSLTISIEAQQSNTLINAFKNPEQRTSLKISPLESELFRFYCDEFKNLRFLEISNKFSPGKIPAFVDEIHESGITGITIYLDSLNELNPELFNISQISRVTIIEKNSSAHIQNDFNIVLNNGKNVKVEYYTNRILQANDISHLYSNLAECKVYFQEREIMSEWLDYNKSYSNINPLVDKKYFAGTYAYINPERDTILELLNGANVKIPANSIVDRQGNKINGKVRIDYTEYKTPFDIFASGIPMEFKTDTGTFNFYSGGMLELLASKNGEEVFLENGKELTLNFNVVDSNEYNLYSFNDTLDNWELQTEQVTQSQNQVIIGDLVTTNYWLTDSASLEEKFFDPSYFYIWKTNPEETEWKWLYKRRVSTGNINKHKMIDITLLKKSDRGGVWFKIKHRNNLDENRAFSNSYWYSLNCTSKKDFKKRYIKRRLYSDMMVDYDDNTKQFTVFLKDQQAGIIQLPCEPRNKGYLNKYENLTDNQLDRINSRQKKLKEKREYRVFYNTSSWNRQNYVNRDFREKGMIKDIKNRASKAYQNKAEMTPDQITMNKREFMNDFYKTVRSEYLISRQRMVNTFVATNISQSQKFTPLTLNGFGVWNCDRISKFSEPVLVNIGFEADSNNLNNNNFAYITLIDTKNRGVINYFSNNFNIDAKSTYVMFVRDENGNLAAVPKDEMKFSRELFEKEKTQFFPLVWSTTNNDYTELKKIAGL
jgi:hypothetical protein